MRACPVCAAPEASFLFARDGYDIAECRTCAMVFVAQDPNAIDFQQLYGEAYYRGGHASVFADYTGQSIARRTSARRRLWVLRHQPRRSARWPRAGRLLDVGCAAGFFLAEALRYYDVQGIELSEWSSAYAREQFGLTVHTGTLASARLPSGQFDIVTMWDVIEHVPDPLSVLADAGRVLAPGGRIVLTTGDWGSRYAQRQGEGWHLLTPPWHLSFFSFLTLSEAARRAGLRVVHVASEGVAGDGWLWRNPLSLLVSRAVGRGDILRATLVHA